VNRLIRDEGQIEGQVTFKVEMDGKIHSVSAMLDQKNYSVAIQAHEARNPVIVTGDLGRIRQRWHIANAAVREFVSDDDED